MAHWLLSYTLAPGYLARRSAFRARHLALAEAAVARGELVLGGAVEPFDAALLLFDGDTAAAAEAFAAEDPYVTEGLVSAWRVTRWRTVVGAMAAETV